MDPQIRPEASLEPRTGALQAVLREETAGKLDAAIRDYNAAQRGDERIDACFMEVESAIRAADEFDDAGQ